MLNVNEIIKFKETIAFSQLGVVALKDVFKHKFVHTVLN